MSERTLTADTTALAAATADAAFTLRVIQSAAAKKQAIAANIATLLQAATFAAFKTAGTIAASGANTDITSLAGTATNDSAAAGKIGEYMSSTVLTASAVSLTTDTAADVTSLSLTAGDWDVDGLVWQKIAGGASCTYMAVWISTTSATAPTAPAGGIAQAQFTMVGNNAIPTGAVRISLAATTTVYLSTLMGFSIGTMAAYGILRARRVR